MPPDIGGTTQIPVPPTPAHQRLDALEHDLRAPAA